MLKIFDDSHLFRLENKLTFDGIGKYVKEIKKGKDNNILYTSDILPVRGVLFNRWLYYLILSLILLFKKKHVVVFPFLYAPFGVWKKYRIVIHDMRYYDFYEKSFSLSIKKLYIEFSLNHADKIICISNFTKDRFFNFFSSSKIREKTSVIHNPFSFDNVNLCLKENIAVYIGHIEYRKNIKGLLEFIKYNSSYKFYIIGNNKMGDEFLDAILPLKNIKYFSNISEEIKTSILMKAKYFINLSKYEGFSYTPMEALQYKLNLILSNIPVHKEIYKDYALFTDSKVKLEDCKFKEVIISDSFKKMFNPSRYQRKVFEN